MDTLADVQLNDIIDLIDDYHDVLSLRSTSCRFRDLIHPKPLYKEDKKYSICSCTYPKAIVTVHDDRYCTCFVDMFRQSRFYSCSKECEAAAIRHSIEIGHNCVEYLLKHGIDDKKRLKRILKLNCASISDLISIDNVEIRIRWTVRASCKVITI